MRGPSHHFPGVDVGLPSKVRGSEAEEEWQEVDWVTWSTGELTVDGDSFLLVFKPSGANIKAKPLGALIRASAVEQHEDGRTMVVTTSDSLNRLYRLTFQSTQHADDFSRLATQAEAAQGVATASSFPDAKQSESAAAEAQSRLEAEIRAALAAAPTGGGPAPPPPLVFGGAELCGPDPGNPTGGEVLLGTGAAVLFDPPESGQVGNWQFLFYGQDEGAREPVKRFSIGPATRLRRLEATPGPDGPAVTFEIACGPRGAAEAYALAFEDIRVADAFARDFRVRLRLMELSLKNVKRARNAQDLLGEITDLKQRTLGARIWRLVSFVVLLVILGAIARLAMLYRQDHGARGPVEYLAALAEDAYVAARLSRAVLVDLGAKVCDAAVGAVPAPDLRRCLAAVPGSGAEGLRLCVEQLVGP